MKLCKLLILVFLIACSKDDEPELIQRIFGVEAYDVGNEWNSTDIRVKFQIDGISDIDQFRIIVLPTNISESFTAYHSILHHHKECFYRCLNIRPVYSGLFRDFTYYIPLSHVESFIWINTRPNLCLVFLNTKSIWSYSIVNLINQSIPFKI